MPCCNIIILGYVCGICYINELKINLAIKDVIWSEYGHVNWSLVVKLIIITFVYNVLNFVTTVSHTLQMNMYRIVQNGGRTNFGELVTSKIWWDNFSKFEILPDRA